MKQNIVIFGANSAIARALAAQLATDGHDLILAGRDADDLARSTADLNVRFDVRAISTEFDALAMDTHADLFQKCLLNFEGRIDMIILCHGLLVEGDDAVANPKRVRDMIDVNYTSAASILELAAVYFEKQKSGHVVAIGSVAGDRGRASNYLYGSSKAALDCYLSGLRQRLSRVRVRVLCVKPGFVDTPMTFGRTGMFLVATPKRVAIDIHRAIRRGRSVIYTPWFWRWIMFIIKSIPEPIFRRLKL